MDLLFRQDAGNGSLGFHYAHGDADDPLFRVQYMIAGGPAHICGQVCFQKRFCCFVFVEVEVRAGEVPLIGCACSYFVHHTRWQKF